MGSQEPGTTLQLNSNNGIANWSKISHQMKKNKSYLIEYAAAAAAAESLQSCPTLCDPIDGSPPGSSVPGILQARTLEWVASSLSNAWKWKVKVKSLSRVRLLATPWSAAHQAPPSMGFSRQEHWSGVPLPSPPITILSDKKSLCQLFSFWLFSFGLSYHIFCHILYPLLPFCSSCVPSHLLSHMCFILM